MEITVRPSPLKGVVEAPPSKSLTQRAIVAGLLARETTVILNPSLCNDSMAAMGMAESLGASALIINNSIVIQPGPVPGSPVGLHCGESGLALRMFAPVAALLSDRVTMNGEGSLLRRPVGMITEALQQLGVNVDSNNGLLPLKLTGILKGGRVSIDGSAGSQLLTGLLMALPLAADDSEIEVTGLKSKPYISLTIKLLDDFGISVQNRDFRYFSVPVNQSYKGREYNIEGDWSGAAFLLVAGALAGDVTVTNLNGSSLQADRAVLNALRAAGCRLTENSDSVRVERSVLKAFSFDATDCPDLFPPLAALASACTGTSSIKGVGRLAHKESDRAGAIADVLESTGITTSLNGDEMLITGGEIHGAVVSSHNDHRIAMMAAVMAASCGSGTITVTGAEAVNKSFPDFYDTLTRLGAQIC